MTSPIIVAAEQERRALRAVAPSEVVPRIPLALDVDDKGRPMRTIKNVAAVLERDAPWIGVLAYDEFRERVVTRRPQPSDPACVAEWSDLASIGAAVWLTTNHGLTVPTTMIDQAVDLVAHRHRYHPVREYLDRLTWDGVPRLGAWLVTYCGADSTAYTRGVGARWCISAVARVYRPGCQVDCTLVLEGAQGAGKSTALRTLVGDDWFSDTPPPIGDKDGIQQLRGVWVIELAELAAVKGREAERVKAFLSARTDTYRPSYARRTVTFHRQCVFAASTNESHYLADRTGNRRFWPVTVSGTDVASLAEDRDQLWAEAVHRYQAGDPWHADTAEFAAMCADAQAEREVGDAWDDALRAFLANPIVEEYNPESGITLARRIDVTQGVSVLDALKGTHRRPGLPGQAEEQRMAKAFRALGYEKRKVRTGEATVWRWFQGSSKMFQAFQGLETPGNGGKP